jgi:2-polyprenyl-3-methyl-5-hydroxy-6-metoxy-1,4-benzoquinol methylase
MATLIRKQLGDEYLIGYGYEFGAGLVPSLFAQVEGITVIDKRDREELTALFGEVPPYEVMDYDSARIARQRDFVTGHHVLEHCPDPIGTIMEWIPLIRRSGTIFLSVPSSDGTLAQRSFLSS